jgi:anti-anti-sigma factor
MDIQFVASEKSLTIKVTGAVTLSDSAGLAERLIKLCDGQHWDTITIDLKECQSLPSAGLGALVGFRLSPNIASTKVVLQSLSSEILAHIKVLRMERLFEVLGDTSHDL